MLSELASNEIAIPVKEYAVNKDKRRAVATTTNPIPVEPSWIRIFKQLQEDEIEFFLNTDLEPTVFIPTDGYQKEWPVNSERFQDHVVSVFYEISEGEMLRPSERDFLMVQIRLECHKGGRQLTASEAEKTDKDVIVQAILALMNQSSEFSGQTAVLVNRLLKIQTECKISSAGEIPIFTNIFSRKLNRLIPVLRGYGIEVVMEHKDSGSHCTLKRLESFQKEPSVEDAVYDGSTSQSSAQPSGVKPCTGSQIQTSDGTDGEMRYEGAEEKSSLKMPQTNNPEPQPMTPNVSVKKGGAK